MNILICEFVLTCFRVSPEQCSSRSVLYQQPQDHLGSCQQCKYLDPTTDQLNQRPWGCGQRPVLKGSPGESNAQPGLRTTAGELYHGEGSMHLPGLSKAMGPTYTPTHHCRSLYSSPSLPTLPVLRIFNFLAHPVCANGIYCDLILAFLISSEVDYFTYSQTFIFPFL